MCLKISTPIYIYMGLDSCLFNECTYTRDREGVCVDQIYY